MSDRPGEIDEGSKSEGDADNLYKHLRPEEDAGDAQTDTIHLSDETERDIGQQEDSNLVEHMRPGEDVESSEVEERKRPGEGGIPEADVLSKAGEEPYKGDLTSAGHAFSKHGRRNPELWGESRGNPENLNRTGQANLNDIINSPDTQWEARHHARFGDIVEGKMPDGRGARWSADGKKLEGFLEPPRSDS